jgi:hypothetical protein
MPFHAMTGVFPTMPSTGAALLQSLSARTW